MDVGIERNLFAAADLHDGCALPGPEAVKEVARDGDAAIPFGRRETPRLVEHDGVMLFGGTADQNRLHQGKDGESEDHGADHAVHDPRSRRQEPHQRHGQEQQRHEWLQERQFHGANPTDDP